MKRDTHCVYCRIKFGLSKETGKSKATWEHIVNDQRIINIENIARCCFSCNSSKGARKLADWLESDYCNKHRITKNTVARVARKALLNQQN